jgi:hypothetical protein
LAVSRSALAASRSAAFASLAASIASVQASGVRSAQTIGSTISPSAGSTA